MHTTGTFYVFVGRVRTPNSTVTHVYNPYRVEGCFVKKYGFAHSGSRILSSYTYWNNTSKTKIKHSLLCRSALSHSVDIHIWNACIILCKSWRLQSSKHLQWMLLFSFFVGVWTEVTSGFKSNPNSVCSYRKLEQSELGSSVWQVRPPPKIQIVSSPLLTSGQQQAMCHLLGLFAGRGSLAGRRWCPTVHLQP